MQNSRDIRVGDYVTYHYKAYNYIIYVVTDIKKDRWNKMKAILTPAIDRDGNIITKPSPYRKVNGFLSCCTRHTIESLTETYQNTINSIKTLQGI